MTSTDLQPSFEDLGTPLFDVTFCVVDLETTGGSGEDGITEIGAVKVRGGQVQGELATLVRPGSHIRGSVQMLTGITDEMVADAPTIGSVLPSWLEFSAGTVLVAHNARFDIGFLRRACAAHDRRWPGSTVVDTLALARSCLHRDEVRDYKLGTLARHFRAATSPTHRALDDARATVDVLHGIIERVSGLGVTTLEDLLEVTHRVEPARRAKRAWADRLPDGPGVYWFHADPRAADRAPEVLYVGTSVNVRRRVRQYFTASETRRRMGEMVRIATGVDARSCSTVLEAGVRELRLIDAHRPRYNRRSRRQNAVNWVTLGDGPYPRTSVVHATTRTDRIYWGPFASRQEAEEAGTAVSEFAGLRQCSGPLSHHPNGCPLAEMGRCSAPCVAEQAMGERYAVSLARARQAMTVDVRPMVEAMAARISALSGQQRYEEAAALTDLARRCLRASRRRARIAALADCPEIVAARRIDRSWEVHVVRHGRLAGAAASPSGADPMPTVEAARATAETVPPRAPGIPACTVEEAELVADWMEEPGVRLVDVDGRWAWPAHCGVADSALATAVAAGAHGGAGPLGCGHVQRDCPHPGQIEQDPRGRPGGTRPARGQ